MQNVDAATTAATDGTTPAAKIFATAATTGSKGATDAIVTRQTRAAGNPLVIRDSASLQRWRKQLRTLTRARNLPAVLFQLPELSYEQNRSLSALAGGYQKACGCTSGSFFMSVTVVALIVSYFVSGGHLSGLHLTHVVSLVGLTSLAALSGKLLGLLWARWQLVRLATHLYDTLVSAAPRATL